MISMHRRDIPEHLMKYFRPKFVLKPKDDAGVPPRFVIAMQADGWYVRDTIAWAKKSPMPESVDSRCTKSWEPIFMFAKSARYFYDAEAVKETSIDPESLNGRRVRSHHALAENDGDGFGRTRVGFLEGPANEEGHTYPTRNLRNVWTIGPEPLAASHFAAFPSEIPVRCIKAGTSEKGCCPECGAPWRRVLKERAKGKSWHDHTGDIEVGNRLGFSESEAVRINGGKYMKGYEPPQTTGWTPACTCGHAETVPCVVLDPFVGSGTTCVAAERLGRHSIGIDLSEKYLREIAVPRITTALVDPDWRQPAPIAGQKELFQ